MSFPNHTNRRIASILVSWLFDCWSFWLSVKCYLNRFFTNCFRINNIVTSFYLLFMSCIKEHLRTYFPAYQLCLSIINTSTVLYGIKSVSLLLALESIMINDTCFVHMNQKNKAQSLIHCINGIHKNNKRLILTFSLGDCFDCWPHLNNFITITTFLNSVIYFKLIFNNFNVIIIINFNIFCAFNIIYFWTLHPNTAGGGGWFMRNILLLCALMLILAINSC